MKKFLIIVVLVLFVGFAGYAYFLHSTSDIIIDDGWRVFSDKNLGIQVEIPKDWIAERLTYANIENKIGLLDSYQKIEVTAAGDDKFAKLYFRSRIFPDSLENYSKFRGIPLIQFSVKRYSSNGIEKPISFVPDFLDKMSLQKLPNGMQAYVSLGRVDQYASEEDIYIQNGSEWYSGMFFVIDNGGGRNYGFTPEEKIIEQRILSSFKFVDPSMIKQSKLSTPSVQQSFNDCLVNKSTMKLEDCILQK